MSNSMKIVKYEFELTLTFATIEDATKVDELSFSNQDTSDEHHVILGKNWHAIAQVYMTTRVSLFERDQNGQQPRQSPWK